MRYWSSMLFSLVFVLTVSFDYFGRYLFPNDSIIINFLMIPLFLASLSLFLISIKWTPKVGFKKQQHPEKILLHRNVFTPLLKENDPLLVLRFFAAFLVFANHMAIILHFPTNGKFHSVVIWGAAWSGMAIFFTLSGYLMGKAFVRSRYEVSQRGIFDFYQSRFWRIFPLMLFVFVIFIVCQYPQVIRFDLASVLRILTFTYSGNTLQYNGIGAMWSLSVEMQYYIIAPFIFLIFERIVGKNRLFAISLLLLVIFLLQGQKVIVNHFIFNKMNIAPNFFSLLGNLPFFLTGFLFNYLKITFPQFLIDILSISWIQAICFVISFIGVSVIQAHLNKEIYYLALSFFTGLIILLVNSIGEKRKFFIRNQFDFFRILQVFGSLSYGFYLWHSGIGFVYSRLFPYGLYDIMSYLVEVLIIAAIVLLMSLATYILIENRFNQYKAINEKITREYKA